MGIRQPCGCPNVVRCMPIVAVFPPNRRSRVGNNNRTNNALNILLTSGCVLLLSGGMSLALPTLRMERRLLCCSLCAMPCQQIRALVHIGPIVITQRDAKLGSEWARQVFRVIVAPC
mmetsp:Transcript_29593/g.34011  ORF Transcript_29593/g.34011 Transcript_29593/m.34011 type:complete len:117 (+) Transcript_29593:370-720(+)